MLNIIWLSLIIQQPICTLLTTLPLKPTQVRFLTVIFWSIGHYTLYEGQLGPFSNFSSAESLKSYIDNLYSVQTEFVIHGQDLSAIKLNYDWQVTVRKYYVEITEISPSYTMIFIPEVALSCWMLCLLLPRLERMVSFIVLFVLTLQLTTGSCYGEDTSSLRSSSLFSLLSHWSYQPELLEETGFLLGFDQYIH